MGLGWIISLRQGVIRKQLHTRAEGVCRYMSLVLWPQVFCDLQVLMVVRCDGVIGLVVLITAHLFRGPPTYTAAGLQLFG